MSRHAHAPHRVRWSPATARSTLNFYGREVLGKPGGVLPASGTRLGYHKRQAGVSGPCGAVGALSQRFQFLPGPLLAASRDGGWRDGERPRGLLLRRRLARRFSVFLT